MNVLFDSKLLLREVLQASIEYINLCKTMIVRFNVACQLKIKAWPKITIANIL